MKCFYYLKACRSEQTRCFQAEHLTVLKHHVQIALICNNNPSVFLGNGHSIELLQSSLQPRSGPQPAHVWNVHSHAHTLMHAHSQAWPRHSLSEPQRQEEECQPEWIGSHTRRGECVRVCVCACAWVCVHAVPSQSDGLQHVYWSSTPAS